ncbi:hypothetical protein GCM10027261_17000 [Geodermatophilus arenarius]
MPESNSAPHCPVTRSSAPGTEAMPRPSVRDSATTSSERVSRPSLASIWTPIAQTMPNRTSTPPPSTAGGMAARTPATCGSSERPTSTSARFEVNMARTCCSPSGTATFHGGRPSGSVGSCAAGAAVRARREGRAIRVLLGRVRRYAGGTPGPVFRSRVGDVAVPFRTPRL